MTVPPFGFVVVIAVDMEKACEPKILTSAQQNWITFLWIISTCWSVQAICLFSVRIDSGTGDDVESVFGLGLEISSVREKILLVRIHDLPLPLFRQHLTPRSGMP